LQGTYLFPASIDEAVRLLGQAHGRARVMAGGTDLMLDLPRFYTRPEVVIDITRIPDLDRIEVGPEWVQVGAAVTFAQLQRDPFLRECLPALVEAAAAVGVRSLQAVATWVGNIVQAMPGADGAVVAVALNAEACVVDEAGAQWLPVTTLYRAAKQSAVDPTHQLVSHVRLSRPPALWGCAWRRLARRQSLALPIVNCAATVQLTPDGAIARATLALGPMGDRPWRAAEVETYLRARRPAPELWQEAGHIAQALADPRSSPLRASRAFRQAAIGPVIAGVLVQASARAAGRQPS
jgi:CO/xanthine dehydrogenase FAD-binding subunit